MTSPTTPFRLAVFDQSVSAGGVRRFTLAMLESWLGLASPAELQISLFWPAADTAGHELALPFATPPHLARCPIPAGLGAGEGLAWLAARSGEFDAIYFPSTVHMLRPDTDLWLDAPAIATLHDLAHEFTDAWGAMTPAVRHEMRQWTHFAQALIFSSDHIRDEATRIYQIPAAKTRRVYLAPPLVDASPASPEQVAALRARYGLPEKFVLSPGTAMVHKNPAVVLEAIGQLKRQGHALPLVLIGPLVAELTPGRRTAATSDYHRGLQRRIADLGLVPGQDLFLLGHIPDEELTAMYTACGCVVTASHSEAGLNGPIFEGMWYRRPLLCSAIPQFVERLGSDDALVQMFDPDDADDLARALRSWDANPQAAAQRARRAFEWVRARDWDDAACEYLDIFRQVAKRHATPPETPPAPPEPGASRPDRNDETDGAASADADSGALVGGPDSWVATPPAVDGLPDSCEIPLAPARLFVDVTGLAEHDARTGIQRVVRAVLQHLLENPPAGMLVEPVRWDRGRSRYCLARRYAAALRDEAATEMLADELVEACPDDVFLGLDLVTDRLPKAMPWLAQQRRRGVRLAFVLYDTLPLRHPEWFPPGFSAMFERWAELLGRHSDAVIGISRAVADDYAAWLAERRITPAPRLAHFHLGADLERSAPTGGLPEDAGETLAALETAPTILMVGTVEPRKGHAQALGAFERLLGDGIEVNLVIVGKPGWMVEALVARLRNHPERGRRLFWLGGVSDEYLDAMYRRATLLLVPTEGEGFGLPLIEGARRGLPILARDLPVFREIAGEHASYFSGSSPEALATALREWLASPGQAPPSTGLRWLTWAESTAQLLAALQLPEPSLLGDPVADLRHVPLLGARTDDRRGRARAIDAAA